MKKIHLGIKRWAKENFTRKDLVAFIIFTVISATVFIGLTFFKPYFTSAVNVILVVELALLAIVAYSLAAHAVMKSLFWVGASLSLMIYLAESYCSLPPSARTGNDALKTLITIGLIYIAIDFLSTLYKEFTARSKTLKQIDRKEHPGF